MPLARPNVSLLAALTCGDCVTAGSARARLGRWHLDALYIATLRFFQSVGRAHAAGILPESWLHQARAGRRASGSYLPSLASEYIMVMGSSKLLMTGRM